MRRVRYLVAMSLDGYIAGPQGEADWIVMDPDIDFAAMAGEFDTLLMGRKTFAPMARTKGGGSPFGAMKIVVVSSTFSPRDHPHVTFIQEDLAQAVAALREGEGKDIWLFGGGELFRSLLGLGLVDTVEVAVIPVLLGGGIPLLPVPAARTTLVLKSHRVYGKTGTVSLVYDVKRGSSGKRRRNP